MFTESTIHDQLKAAVSARKGSLKALRARIAALLKPIPIGVKLSDEEGEVCKVVRASTGASQWSNREWMVTIKGRGYITPAGKLLAEDLDGAYFDGSNMHYRTSEPTVLGVPEWGDDRKPGLTFEPGTITRALAARLPAAIERYMAECERERAANEQTLV